MSEIKGDTISDLFARLDARAAERATARAKRAAEKGAKLETKPVETEAEAPPRPPRPPETVISILECEPKYLATKRWTKNGKIDFNAGAWFTFHEETVSSIDELHDLIESVSRNPRKLIVRGFPAPGVDTDRPVRRMKHPVSADKIFRPDLEYAGKIWFEEGDGQTFMMVDIDSKPCPEHLDVRNDPEGVIAWVAENILRRTELENVTFVWQFSSSMGMKPAGTLSIHLFYLLDRPYTAQELKRWIDTTDLRRDHHVDPSPWEQVQPNYVASPVFEDGLVDPLSRRIGLYRGTKGFAALTVPLRPAGRTSKTGKPRKRCAGGTKGAGWDDLVEAHGFDEKMAFLGDGDGWYGFQCPIVSAIAAYVSEHGKTFDRLGLKERIRAAIDAAPKRAGRAVEEIDRYKSNAWLDEAIDSAIAKFGDQAEARRNEKDSFDPLPPETDAERRQRERYKSTRGTKEEEENDLRHVIGYAAENEARVVDLAEEALIAADLGLYKRGGLIVRGAWEPYTLPGGEIVHAKRLVQVRVPGLLDHLSRAAILRKMRVKNGQRVPVPVEWPRAIAEKYLEREGQWKLPPLLGLISAPILRHDGSILQTPGYDPATRLIYNSEDATFPVIPDHPTRDDALHALAVLAEPIAKFPFVDETARSAMLAAMLTACVRRSLPTAPAFAIDAPTQGTGKGKLQSILAALAEGHRAIPVSAAKGDEELEKRLDAELLRGAPIVSIDNVVRPLDTDRLAAILTEPMVKCRVLGQSKVAETPTGVMVTITGNNLDIRAELGRRIMRIRIDAAVEKPWDRQFEFDPVEMVLSDRPRFVTAALTVLRAYHVAGRPKPPGTLGSFETWYHWIVGALVWLNCANPKSTVDATTADDPELQAYATTLEAWQAVFNNEWITTKELTEGHREKETDFDIGGDAAGALHAALAKVAPAKNGGIDCDKIGYWLRRYKDRPANGRRLEQSEKLWKGSRRWRVAPLKE